MPRISEFFDGMKPFVIGAAVLVFFGMLCILLELQSFSFVQWDGIKVRGDTYGGVTTYTYHGQSYSIDDPKVSASDNRHIPTTVWLSRSHPEDPNGAMIESPWDRWTDFVFVTSWFFGALLLLAIGFIRLLLRRRRREATMLQERFGTGLDPEVVERLLTERRSPPRPVVVDED